MGSAAPGAPTATPAFAATATFTFGYRFKPWRTAPIATAAEIPSYMGEVIDENGLAAHIRYRHQITRASWSSSDNLWTIDATRTDTGEAVRFTTNFL